MLRTVSTVEKSRGRVERRTLTTTTNLIDDGYLTWPGARQMIRLERETTIKGKTRKTVTYAITSLSREKANAPDLLSYVRGRWAIENSCFYILDTALDEDASRVRTGNAAVALSAMRQSLLNFCRGLGQRVGTTIMEHAVKPLVLLSRLRIFN